MLNCDRFRIGSFCDQLDYDFARLAGTYRAPPVQSAAQPVEPAAKFTGWAEAVHALSSKQMGLSRAEAQNLVMRVRKLQPDLADTVEIIRAALRLRGR